jgi:hypothetical protein
MKVKLRRSTPQPSYAMKPSQKEDHAASCGFKMDKMTSILPILAFGRREWILKRKVR